MAYTIYKKDGSERVVVIDNSTQPNAGKFVEPQLEYSGTWMGECFVTLNIKSPVPIDFAIGDYVMYRGEKFVINYDPSVIKKATKKSTGDAFCYDNVKFTALLYELSDIRMLDYVIDDNHIHWNGLPKYSAFCATIDDFADRLQANADRWCAENGIADSEKWVFVTPSLSRSTSRAGSRASDIYSDAFAEGADNDDELTNQNVSIDNMSVWDSMKYIKETFGLNFIVRGRSVIIGAAGIPVDGIFQYGKDNGLYEIERVADSEQQIITKLFAYGTDKNLPTRYYADMSGGDLPNNLAVNALMLPGFPEESLYSWVKNSGVTTYNDETGYATWHGFSAFFSKNPQQPYIESIRVAVLGVREATKYFDGSDGTEEVYPSITAFNTNTVYSAEVIEDAGVFPAGQEVDDFTITLSSFGANDFVLSDYITSESAISMLDGSCGGRDFQIVSATQDEETLRWTLTCHRVHDESLDIWFPYSDGVAHGGSASANELYQIHSGDHFVFVGIEMPEEYVEAASERLLEGALQFLAKNDTTRYTYIPKVDEIYMARQSAEAEQGEEIPIHDKIKEGSLLVFEDDDLAIDDAVFIDTLRIKEYGNQQIPTYEVTLRNEKQVGTIQRIQEQIGKITSGETSIGGGTGGSVNIPLVKSLIQTYGTDLFLRKDKESTAAEIIRFLKGIKFGSSNQWYINGDGEAVLNSLNVDNLNALNAHFAQLIIDEIKSVGGMVIISPSNAKIYAVQVRSSAITRLYFKAYDGERRVYQTFMQKDQVLCATFNTADLDEHEAYEASNKFYWTMVYNVSSEPIEYEGELCHWIGVYSSSATYTKGVFNPEAGDEITLLGNRGTSDAQMARRNAIVISAYDIDFIDTGYGQSGDVDYVPKLKAPFIVQYAGINDFNLYNKRVNVISHGYNVFKGDFKANTGEDLMETISQIEEGRLSFVHQAWAANAVEKADHGWTLTGFNLNYFNGARFMCMLSDHTQGEAHLNETIFSSAPDPNANPPVPKKNWVPFNYDISSVDYYYAKTTTGDKPADSTFSSSYPSDIGANDYIWTKEVITYSNGLVSTSYSSLRIADDGVAGSDGVSSYLHIAYASSADGSQNFSTTPLANSTYIGFYRNEEQLDPSGSTAYTLYTWSKYVGDAGLNGLSAPPAYKETTVPHYLVYASGTGVTKSTSGWVDNTAPALTDEKPYLWRYDTTTYEAVGGVQNMLLDSTNQFNYYAQNGSYIAKIKLAENLVNGNTYSLVFKAEDLSTFSITKCSVDIYFTTSWIPPGKSSGSRHTVQATDITQEADGTCRVTFTAIADADTNKQLALYVTGTGLSGGVPDIYWAMLTEGGVQYDWIAAPEDLKKETTPAVVATKGRGIGQIAEYYAKNNSNTTPPSGWDSSPYTGWSTTPVAADATNKYVWNFEVITYTDGTTVVTTPHVSSGYALGISNKTVTYAVTSSTSQPQDTAFTYTTVPTVNKGEYLWTKTEITYGDNSVTKAYSVSYKATDGTSPVYADIDNEMDSIACTTTGVPASAQTVSTKVSMWNGSTKVSSPTIKVYDDTTSGAAYTSGSAKNGITATWSASTGAITFAFATSVTAFDKKVFCITVSKSINGATETRELYFTVNGIRPGADGTNGTNGTNGADGANAVIYNLVPSANVINVGRDGSNYSPSTATLTCGYVKNDGGTATKVDDATERIDSKYNLYFRRRTRSNSTWQTTFYLYTNSTYKAYLSGFSVATYDAIEFVLATATSATRTESNIGTIIDRETVPVVADGEEGNGISGAVVAYGKSSSGTTQPTSWQSTIPSVPLGQYLWTRVTTSYTDGSADTVSYSISRIGTDGEQGTPGATGADGRTTYLHMAYANSADGSVNFNTSYFAGATYIGTCTDFNESDPTTYSSYEWAELRGMDNAGVYVSAVKNYYKTTATNATPAIDDTWVLCPPGTIPQPDNTNKYLWNYEVTEYGCQYPNMVLNSDNPTIGGDPYLFRFNSTNEFVHDEVYSFAMKLGQLPSPKTYYCLQIQGTVQKNGETIHNSRAISQSVGQDPTRPTRLIPNEDGIIMGTFKCDIYVDNLDGYIDQTQHVWVSAYPEGGTYDVPSFDWITVVKGTQVASWTKALSELTQTVPPHLMGTFGEKGDSPWVADLTNEMDAVSCDDTGYPVAEQAVSTVLSLFYGETEKNFGTPAVKRNGSTITIGTATNGVTVTYSNKVLTVTYATTAKITGKDDYTITLTASEDSNVVRTLTFTVNGVKGDVYNLLPSVKEIAATRDAQGSYLVNGIGRTSVKCGYTKNINGTVTTGSTDVTDDESSTLDIEGKYNIYFRRRRRADGEWGTTTKALDRWYLYTNATYRAYLVQATEGATDSGLNVDVFDAVEFALCTSTASYRTTALLVNVIDRETVYVVADGLAGGKGDFKATVFKRQNSQPATPTGGTYANPVPSGWSDGIPSGGEMVWASTRIFKIDDNTTTWTTPQQMTDTMTYDVEFAKMQAQDATPAKPTDANRHGGSGTQVWFDPAQDTTQDYTQMYWRAERECSNGTWSDWVIVRIKGESGAMITNAVLTRSNTASWWQGKCGSTTSTGWSDPDGIIPADMRVGDIFVVQGEATDTGDFYTIYMRYDRTSGTTKYGTPVSYTISRKGTDGAAGTSVTITNTETRYRKATSVTDTDAWWNGGSTTFPSVDPGDTVWSRTVVTYSDGSTTKTVGSSRIGTDGSDGLPGSDSYTHFAYANSADGATDFSTTYFDGARYIGILVDRQQADSTTYSDYTWSQFLGDSGLSAPPELTESITPYWQASSAATGVTPATGTWSQTPVVPTEALKYLWYYETVAYNAPEQGRNMLRDSTNQWSYTTRSSIYIAKIRLWEPLVAGETYTIVFSVDDLSKLSTGNVTVRTLYNSSASTRIQATIKVHEGNLYRATFKALDATEATQVAIYIGVSGFTATSPEVCPTVHWAMLTRGDTAYSWQAAPQDMTYSTTPDVRSQYPEQGAGFAGVSLLRNRAESWWQTEIAQATETWGVGNTGEGMAADIVAACRVGDIFAIYGEATDTHNNYILYHQYTGASGDTKAKGKYVMHTVSKAGAEGNGISSTTEYYLVSNLMTGVTRNTEGWQGSIATPTEDKPYLWNYEDTLYTNGTHRYTTPHIVSTYNRSAGGSSFISGVYNYYLVTATGSGVTRTNVPADASWVQCPPNTPPVPTAAKRYLWNYEMTTWDAPEQGRNLLVTKVANGRYTMSSLPDNGTTVTASVRLTVPEGKTHIKFALYGKNANGTSTYSTQLNLEAEEGALQTLTGTFAFNNAAYTDITEFRVYVTTGANSGMALASDIEWVKLEKGALPTPYSEAPENLTEYTDAHVVCIHGEDGEPADHYELNPLEEYALVDINTNGVRQLVVWLKYSILHVEGASVTNTAAVGSTTDGLHIRYKVIPISGAVPSSWSYFPTGTDPQIKPNATTYSGISSNAAQYKIELVKRTNGTDVVVDRRNVVVAYNAKASFTIDSTTNTISSIVQGSSTSDPNSLVNQMSTVRQSMGEIESTVETHSNTLDGIPNTYATKTSVEQTASSITSKVQNQMLNGANLLINSKDQTSGFDSSSSSAYDKEQTNTYYACYYFGADKPTAGDTFTVSWKQTNATGATKYRLYLFTDESGVYLNPTAVNLDANGLYSVTVNLAENFPANVTKCAIYVSSPTSVDSITSLAEVEWAKAEYGTTASAWNPNISETGSEIKQIADNIIMAVEGTGINIDSQQITLNGDTEINGTLILDASGEGFKLLSDDGVALITPETIGSYASFCDTTYTNTPQYHQEAGAFYGENDYYRTIPYSMYLNLGTFDQGSDISVQNISFSHIVLTDGYPAVTGSEIGSIIFSENGTETTYTLSSGTAYSYITTVDDATVTIRITGYFKVASGTTSYNTLDALKSGNIVTMFGFTLRTPVKGAFVRVASDGLGVNAGNGKTAYFGPDGFHISPLLQNVKTISANYTASFTDDIIMVNNSSMVTLTLPTNGVIPEGKKIYVKKMTSNSTLRVQATFGSSGMIYKCNSASAVAYEDSTSPVMTYYISFDTGSGIGWLQGYCG